MQIERTENAKKKCKKKMQLTREKGGPRPKKAVQNGSKLFSDAFSAGESLSFQGINCKNFCQEKVENAKQMQKMQHTREKRPFTKKMQKKIQKNATTLKKVYAKRPKMQKKMCWHI